MYLILELLFYPGLILLGIGGIWGLMTLLRRRWIQLKYPAMLLFVGGASIAAPAIFTRFETVDLGPRLVLVAGEKHITLTGWEGES